MQKKQAAIAGADRLTGLNFKAINHSTSKSPITHAFSG
jgi:hypothetical protein